MENAKEIWKDIPGYDGFYQISNLGRVKSLKLYKGSNDRILKLSCDSKGYLKATLSKNNKTKSGFIHRLIAQLFIPNPLNLNVVNHIDCNIKNNSIENLEWCNTRHNILHSIKMGSHIEHYRSIRINKNTRGENKYVGVNYNRRDKKWVSKISINGKSKHIGQFDTEIEALECRKSALIKYGFATVEELNKL